MFTHLEKTIKDMNDKLDRIKLESEGAHYRAAQCWTAISNTRNLLLGLFIFVVVNMMMTATAVVYAIQARDESRVNLIHLEHIEKKLQEKK
jgi:hypothetical protein